MNIRTMNEHTFYEPSLKKENRDIILNEEESYHLIKVLRIQKGNPVSLMNGCGFIAQGIINELSKKQAFIELSDFKEFPKPIHTIHLAICPLKKRDKLEWIIEKATEIGVSEISFINSVHAERSKLNMERFQKIVISSAKQSINPFFPKINPIRDFKSFINGTDSCPKNKFIAWCGTNPENHLLKHTSNTKNNLILIGPEGDFSEDEVNYATGRNFVPVSLGNLRFRSETAAIYAVSVLHGQYEIQK